MQLPFENQLANSSRLEQPKLLFIRHSCTVRLYRGNWSYRQTTHERSVVNDTSGCAQRSANVDDANTSHTYTSQATSGRGQRRTTGLLVRARGHRVYRPECTACSCTNNRTDVAIKSCRDRALGCCAHPLLRTPPASQAAVIAVTHPHSNNSRSSHGSKNWHTQQLWACLQQH